MQMNRAFRRLLILQIIPVFFASSTSGQEVKATPPISPIGQQVQAIRPVPVRPLMSSDSKRPLREETSATGQEVLPLAGSDLVLGSGDFLAISLYGIPDFSKEVRVSENGDITLPLIGSVRVAGLTIQSTETAVRNLLIDGGFFADPQVSIIVRESASQGTSVLGEVQKPGIYYLPGQRTLFDALSAAGGTTLRAGNIITITRRGQPDDIQTVTLPSDQTLPAESNVTISPGDTIVVSKAGVVYVVGDVRMPGGFVMENSNLTALQALALAQGANPTAKLDKTTLIRRTQDGRQEISVPFSKIMAANSPDPILLADDIIFVPRSSAKAGFRRGLEAALQTAVGVAIYRPL